MPVGRSRALLAAFLWTAGGAQAADLCRDAQGRFTACPEAPVNLGDPEPVPEPTPPPAPPPSPAAKRQPISIRAYGGGLVSIATDTEAAIEPLAALHVSAPLTTSAKGPSLVVHADLTAGPGETIDFTTGVQTFKAIELGVAVVQPLGGPLLFNLYLEGGFASRLATDPEPVDRLPGWWSGGLLFATADRDHWLKVGMGPDERLSGDWALSVHVAGQAKVGERAGVSLFLVGSLIRALDLSSYGYVVPARDSLRLGVAVGR